MRVVSKARRVSSKFRGNDDCGLLPSRNIASGLDHWSVGWGRCDSFGSGDFTDCPGHSEKVVPFSRPKSLPATSIISYALKKSNFSLAFNHVRGKGNANQNCNVNTSVSIIRPFISNF